MIVIAATSTQAAAVSTPIGASGRRLFTPNTSAPEAMIRPPAERPTKNANEKM